MSDVHQSLVLITDDLVTYREQIYQQLTKAGKTGDFAAQVEIRLSAGQYRGLKRLLRLHKNELEKTAGAKGRYCQ